MMKKRIQCLLLTVLMCLSMVPLSAYATSENDIPCYIASLYCPQGYIDYASENIGRFTISMHDNLNLELISVGNPFSFTEADSDIFYFPVLYDGIIKYLFRVFPDENGYSAVMSGFLTEELNSLAHLTSENRPMYLKCKGSEIVATIGLDEYKLFEYPENFSEDETANISTYENRDLIIKNVKENDGTNINLIQPKDVFEYVQLKIDENDVQTDESWCVAFCLATVIRTIKGIDVTGEDIMKKAYGNNYSKSTTFPWNDMTSIIASFELYSL